MVMYINETKFYPGNLNHNANGVAYAVWPTRLRKYMKGNQAVFRCPSVSRDFDWVTNSTTPPVAAASDTGCGYNVGESLLVQNVAKLSYGYNDWGAGQSPVSPFPITMDGSPNPGDKERGLGGDIDLAGGRELKATRVRHTADMIAITDMKLPFGTQFSFNVDPNDLTQAPSDIHHGGSNVLWCDAHVTWKAQKELVLYDLKNVNLKYWNFKNTPLWTNTAPQWNNDHMP